jgi:predicted ribosome quality control (RQC) complex YloA/Tae2 family protein
MAGALALSRHELRLVSTRAQASLRHFKLTCRALRCDTQLKSDMELANAAFRSQLAVFQESVMQSARQSEALSTARARAQAASEQDALVSSLAGLQALVKRQAEKLKAHDEAREEQERLLTRLAAAERVRDGLEERLEVCEAALQERETANKDLEHQLQAQQAEAALREERLKIWQQAVADAEHDREAAVAQQESVAQMAKDKVASLRATIAKLKPLAEATTTAEAMVAAAQTRAKEAEKAAAAARMAQESLQDQLGVQKQVQQLHPSGVSLRLGDGAGRHRKWTRHRAGYKWQGFCVA